MLDPHLLSLHLMYTDLLDRVWRCCLIWAFPPAWLYYWSTQHCFPLTQLALFLSAAWTQCLPEHIVKQFEVLLRTTDPLKRNWTPLANISLGNHPFSREKEPISKQNQASAQQRVALKLNDQNSAFGFSPHAHIFEASIAISSSFMQKLSLRKVQVLKGM